MKKRIEAALILLAASLQASAVFAASGSDIAANGTSAGAPACSSCHGDQGEGQPIAGFPRIGALSAGYIAHQLASFANSSRKSEIMQPIAAALTQDEQKAVADYYASLPIPKEEADTTDKNLIESGAALAKLGDWSRGLPGCSQCHGTAGLGVGQTFPPLTGQSAAYIESQLQAWKSGERKNDPMGLMANVAKKLDDNQIKAVAAYYASLPVTKTASSEAKQ